MHRLGGLDPGRRKEATALRFHDQMLGRDCLVALCMSHMYQTYQRKMIIFKWEMQSVQNVNVMYIIFYSEGDLQDVDS